MNNENVEKKSILQKELNTKEVLLVLGVCALVFIYGYVFIYPRYAEYKTSVQSLEGIEQQINTYQGQINQLPQLEEKLRSLNKEINVKSKMLAHNMEDGMFLIGLSKLMSNVNVDLVEYTVEEPTKYNTFYAIPTTIEVRGNYKNVRDIISYLEQQKNMTQVLDYSMETYIEEKTTEQLTQNNQQTTVTTTASTNQNVYWTLDGTSYHTKDCDILIKEAENYGGSALMGTPGNTDNLTPCTDCNPNSTTQVTTQVGQTQTNTVQETTEAPKSTGDIVARFSFVMYSNENPTIELKNDDYTTWQPGKWNPFTTTTR